MIKVRRFLLVCLVTAMFLTLPAILVNAQGDDRATVRVDGRALFRVGPFDELTARERADQIERRLNNLLENPQAIRPARVETSTTFPDRRIITVASVAVVTITETDAEDNLTTVDLLAAQWQRSVDEALQMGAGQRTTPGRRFVAEVRGSVQAAFAGLIESTIVVIPRILAALMVIGLFWIIAFTARWVIQWFFQRTGADPTVENLMKQVAYYSIWLLGLIVALDAFGFNPQVVLTSLGLGSLALGFALKDIISNFVSGILILALRPFQLGDQIVVGETEGTVERINLRATQMRTYDGRRVQVPNAELFTSRVTNNTASPVRRASVTIQLSYGSDLRKVSRIMEEAVSATQGVLAEPPPSIRVRELGQDDITIEARFWTDSRRSDYVLTTSSVRVDLIEALRREEIPLPDSNFRYIRANP